MTRGLATVVDLDALFELVWVSLAAGIGLTVAFSCAILGAARAGAQRRAGRIGPAGAYAALAAVSIVVVAAMLVAGVAVMLEK